MTHPLDVLATLAAAGLKVASVGPNALHLSPRERITPELRALAIEHKAAILASLGRQTATAGRMDGGEDGRRKEPAPRIEAVTLPPSPRRPARLYWRMCNADGSRVVLLLPPPTTA